MAVDNFPVAVGVAVQPPAFTAPEIIRYLAPEDPFPAAIGFSTAPLSIGQPSIVRVFNVISLAAVNKTVGSLTIGRPVVGQIFKIVPLQASSLVVKRPVFEGPYFSQKFMYGGDMRGLPAEPADATPYYRAVNAIWPDLLNQRAIISPARNGVNRDTGRMLQGWEHVEQSMKVIFATPFHERILRRWVGSYVPYILGETYVKRVVTRFFWAIAVSLDFWEPNYRVKQVHYMNDALSQWTPKTLDAVGEYRLGHGIFRTEGVYRPRAHLGDIAPYQQRAVGLTGGGTEIWDPALAPAA